MNSEMVTRLIGEDALILIYKPYLLALNGNVQQAMLLTYLVEKNTKNFGYKVSLTFSEIKEKLLIEMEDVMDAIISFGDKMWLHQFTITEESIEVALNLEKIARDVALNLEKIARDVGDINGRR